jgi:hypothetical protein
MINELTILLALPNFRNKTDEQVREYIENQEEESGTIGYKNKILS